MEPTQNYPDITQGN